MRRTNITILNAPSPLGLKPPREGAVPGVWRAPEVLRQAGLHRALAPRSVETVSPPPYAADIDSALGVRNPHAIAEYSIRLADAVGTVLESGAFTVAVGGDCSILLGTCLALRRRGRAGLVYIDAHPDCLTPETSSTGGVAGMPVAVVTGRGPALLTNLEDRRPYVQEADVVVVGCRDMAEITGADEKRVRGFDIRVWDLDAVRHWGPDATADAVLRYFVGSGVDGLWVHVDADVLDASIMAAVDSPEPGGMLPDELVRLLAPLLASPLALGVEFTIYDPERDQDGSAALVMVDVIRRALT